MQNQEPPARVTCDQAPAEFKLLCDVYEDIVVNYIGTVDAHAMAETAATAVSSAGLASIVGTPPACPLPDPAFEQVCAAIDLVEDTAAAVWAATEGMVESLNDPYSILRTPAEQAAATAQSERRQSGLGIGVSLLDGDRPCTVVSASCRPVIDAVYPGGPAAQAGLMVGDVLVEMNGPLPTGLRCEAVPALGRFADGTVVAVKVSRGAPPVTATATVTAAAMAVPVARSRVVGDKIGYLRLDRFSSSSSEDVAAELRGLLDDGVDRLVFDLRQNSGGDFRQSVSVAVLFLADGLTVVNTHQRDNDDAWNARSLGSSAISPLASDPAALPMVLLHDEWTASGAEIVVGALVDHRRANTVGSTTFGKDIGQVPVRYVDHDDALVGILHLTSLRFATPSGRSVAAGLAPDFGADLPMCLHPDEVSLRALDVAVVTPPTPSAPALYYVAPGDSSLTVSWLTPTRVGSSAVTGYDVRHIRSDASNKSDETAWIVIDSAANASTRSFPITGLDNSVMRDVQVRAVNTQGVGDWSVTGRGTPGATNSRPFFVEGDAAVRAVVEAAVAAQSIGSPFEARDFESDTFTYSLGGTDAALFDIDSASGQLKVKEPLDFESDRSHEVTVSVSDSKDAAGGADTAVDATVAVTVVVENVDEPGEVGLSSLQPQAGTALTATLVEPDGGLSGLAWSWESSASGSGPWEPTTVASSGTYIPQDADVGRYLRVTASYEDNHGTGKTARAVSDSTVRAAPASNNAPEFPATEDGMRSVAEDTAQHTAAGRSIGSPVAATDADNDVLTYSLSGSHAGLFDIDVRSGQLLTRAELDYESRSSYSVTVAASDPSNEKASILVTVRVTDVEEAGTVQLSSEFPRVGEALTATLSDPDGGVSAVAYQWHRSTSRSVGWVVIDDADSRTYSPVEADLDHYLRATALYTDRHQPQLQESAAASTLAAVSQPVDPGSVDPGSVGAGPVGGGGTTGGGTGGGGGGGGGGAPEVEEPQDGASDQELAQLAADRFEDVDTDDYFAAAVGWMLTHGITAGCDDDSFCAAQPVTRQQFVVFLWRAAGEPEPSQPGSQIFTDVTDGGYADKAIGWAFEHGVTAGCARDDDGNRRFCPHRPSTRAHISVFLYRYTGAQHAPERVFADVDPSSYYAAAVAWMHAHGITTGCADDSFCPHEPATRAQAATFIYRIATRPDSWGTNGGILKQPS